MSTRALRPCACALLAWALASGAGVAAELSRSAQVSGAGFGPYEWMAEARGQALFGGVGTDLDLWAIHDGANRYGMDAFHGCLSLLAASRSEGYSLSGLVGVSYTLARSRGAEYGALAPDVGARFLWEVARHWHLHLDGALSMYEDGYVFVGGAAFVRDWRKGLRVSLGWRMFWVTGESTAQMVKHGLALGVSF